jgi:hypothetical protein
MLPGLERRRAKRALAIQLALMGACPGLLSGALPRGRIPLLSLYSSALISHFILKYYSYGMRVKL